MPNFTLNEQQKDIVNEVVNGTTSINVVARAGCGKTYTLINGVITAIVENNLGSVALMAFNKSAADEFKAKLLKLADETGNNGLLNVDAGTVHSFGFRAYRSFYGGKTKVDGWKVTNIIRKMFEPNECPYLRQASTLVSLAKQSVMLPEELRTEASDIIAHFDIDANGNEEDIIDIAVKALEASNKERSIIDFDDMIYLPLIFNARVDTYDFVCIDEAQDTNPARRQLAFKMMKPNARLIAVGDDKQAIYGFTGANSDSLQLIKEALGSVELPLTITYRCPKAVVAEANSLVPDLTAHESAPDGMVRRINSMMPLET